MEASLIELVWSRAGRACVGRPSQAVLLLDGLGRPSYESHNDYLTIEWTQGTEAGFQGRFGMSNLGTYPLGPARTTGRLGRRPDCEGPGANRFKGVTVK
jgi:hypothetical protein